jgi:hypothetical protein
MAADVPTRTHSVRETAAAYARGVVGGLLVGMPTLMTMEMWWGGFTIPSVRILLLVVVNFGIFLVLQGTPSRKPSRLPVRPNDCGLVQVFARMISQPHSHARSDNGHPQAHP